MIICFSHNGPVVWYCCERGTVISVNFVCFLQNYDFQDEDLHIMMFGAQSGFATGS